MLTRKHKARLRAYIKSLKSKFSDSDISDLVKKKARSFNPATTADVDDFLSREGLPPSDGNKVHVVDE